MNSIPPNIEKGIIVVVEDDDSQAHLLQQILERNAGYRVERFASAEAAMERARKNCIDALVVDINLPGMSGPSMIQALHLEGIRTPCLFVAIEVTTEDVAFVKRIPWCDVIHKPVDEDKRGFVSVLEHLIDRYQTRAQVFSLGYAVQKILTRLDEQDNLLRNITSPVAKTQASRALAIANTALVGGYRIIVAAGIWALSYTHPELVKFFHKFL